MNELALDVPVPVRTYGTLALSPDRRFWQISDVEAHVSIRLKQIFPRLPKQSTGPFSLNADNITSADLLWFTDRYPLAMSEPHRAVLEDAQRGYLRAQAEMERILLPSYVMPAYVGLRDGQEVRHYQAQAIELCARSGALLLGDECGLGKTFTAAGFCLDQTRLPAVIVCQIHIQRQWVNVLKAFTILTVHEVKKASPYDLPPADVYVFRYTQIAGWVDVFAKGFCRTVVYDEPQELRGGMATAKGGGAKVLSDHASWKLGLTATPIYNYGSEIFNIMQFIKPDVFGKWDDFVREYCEFSGNGKYKLRDPKAVGTFMREQHAFMRRTKAEVGKEMPPVNRIVDVVDYDADVVESIEAVARHLAIRATTGAFVDRGSAARDLDLMVRQATGVAKARHVAAMVRVLIESGEPVLLMGWHRAVYDIWLRELADLNPQMYTGTESGTQKLHAKEEFLSGRSNLLIMSLRSAAGLDGLQARCSTIVFGELDWSPGVHHQCIERLSRDGQENPVMAMFLVAEDGSDPPMMGILGLKASEANQVIDPTLGVQTAYSDESRVRLIAERYLSKKERAALPAPAKQEEMAL